MKQYLTPAVIAVVVVALALTFFGTKTIVNNIGASTGPDNFFPCESHNGVQSCFIRAPFVTATTTPVSMKSPNATSTVAVACRSTNSTTTAQTYLISTGSGQQSSTTALGSAGVAAGALGAVNASTTLNLIIAPNNWVQFNAFGGVGTSNLTGFCSATFTII